MSPQKDIPNQVPIAVSDIMELRKKGRLGVPVSVLKATGLFNRGQTQSLIAELLEPGRIRLHLSEDIRPQLESRKGELEPLVMQGDQEALEELSIIADKYRAITMESDGRLRLPVALLVHIGAQRDAHAELLVRAHNHKVEILSLARREQLIAVYNDDL